MNLASGNIFFPADGFVALAPFVGDAFEGSLDCCPATAQVANKAAHVATNKTLAIRDIGLFTVDSILICGLDVSGLEAVVGFRSVTTIRSCANRDVFSFSRRMRPKRDAS
jgi:hypothetical protein